jgi:anaerobic selenocysteine-containing dehydrogenase
MQELASRLQLSEPWLHEDRWQALEMALREAFAEASLHELLDGQVLRLKLRPNNEYQTPSGRIEFSSSTAHEIGVHQIPVQMEAAADDEWLVLLNSSLPKYTHSQFTDVYGPIPQVVWMCEADAGRANVDDGDEVVLHNELGKVHLKAVVNDRTGKGTLWAPRPLIGLQGNPLNILTPSTAQTIGGGPNTNATRVKIHKAYARVT